MRVTELGSVADLLFGADDVAWLLCPGHARGEEGVEPSTIGEIKDESLAFAGRLAGLADRGSPVLLVLENGAPFVVAFFGCLLAGMVPVPLATPHFAQARAASVRRIEVIVANAGGRLVVTDGKIKEVLGELAGARVVSFTEVLEAPWRSAPCPSHGSETALVQYTSGSTEAPRGVELSHENILHNVRAIGEALNATSRDVGVSWLPLFHDMGLIGSLLFTLAFRMPLILLEPRTFAFHPLAWLRAISRYRGTLSPAPTSAYQLCVSRVRDSELSTLDLSSFRVGLVGSEMVDPSVLRSFHSKFSRCGFSGTLAPAYGLAENALAVALGRPGVGPRIDTIERRAMDADGRAVPSTVVGESREIVSAGSPIRYQEVRVTGGDGTVLRERCVGEIEVRGPCVMKGYRGSPESTAMVLGEDGWLKTGDRGYRADGELFVVGRQKDVIKKLGSCFDASTVEVAVKSVRGIRGGRVAAFGVHGAHVGERMIVAVETALVEPASLLALRREVVAAVVLECGVRPDEILCVAPGALPRTTSGKIQRRACGSLFESGAFTERTPVTSGPSVGHAPGGRVRAEGTETFR